MGSDQYYYYYKAGSPGHFSHCSFALFLLLKNLIVIYCLTFIVELFCQRLNAQYLFILSQELKERFDVMSAVIGQGG